jgi:hypothetical protein
MPRGLHMLSDGKAEIAAREIGAGGDYGRQAQRGAWACRSDDTQGDGPCLNPIAEA